MDNSNGREDSDESNKTNALSSKRPIIALVGNPNVGKSAIFNLLTGKYAVVSNYPGTTVEIATGTLHYGTEHFTVIDTPGANSLSPRSEDERVTRDILLEQPIRAVIQVADAKNLRRALLLTIQLAELQIPVVFDLNMWDEALERGIAIDVKGLEQVLGVPVVRTVATQRRGVRELVNSIARAKPPQLHVDYGPIIEKALKSLEAQLPSFPGGARALGLMLLCDDPHIEEALTTRLSERGPARSWPPFPLSLGFGHRHRFRHRHMWGVDTPGGNFSTKVHMIRMEAQHHFAAPLSYVINQKRAQYVEEIVGHVTRHARFHPVFTSWRQVALVWTALPVVFFLMGFKLGDLVAWLTHGALNLGAGAQWGIALGAGVLATVAYMGHLLGGVRRHYSLTRQLGDLTMHPVLAFPILFIVLWLLYKIVGQFGAGTCVDFMQKILFLGYIIPGLAWVAERVVSSDNLLYQLLFSEDAGLISVGLTYSLSIVMPIVAFFFLSFGVLEDSGYLPRLAVLLDQFFKKMGLTGKAVLPMVLGLGCGTMAVLTTRIMETRKQRTIAIFLLALAVPCSAQLGIISAVLGRVSGLAFAIYVLVIVSQMLFVGYLASKIIPGEKPDFLIEIPPVRIPGLMNILVKTLHRLHWFMREAVPLFLLGTFILFVLTKIGLLKVLEAAASPLVVGVLALPHETTAGFLLGFLRRDYGVISIFSALDKVGHGHIPTDDLLVALTVMTLFVPCLASFFVIIKEQGLKRALLMVAFIFLYAFLVGGLLRQALKIIQI